MKIAIIILLSAILSDYSDSKKLHDFMFIQDTQTRIGMMIMEKTPFLSLNNNRQLPLLRNDVSGTNTAQWMKIASQLENNPNNKDELLKKWCAFVQIVMLLIDKWREGHAIEKPDLYTYWEQNSLMVKAIEAQADVDFPQPYDEQTFNTTYLEKKFATQYIYSISKHQRDQFIDTPINPDGGPGGLGAPPKPPKGTDGAGGAKESGPSDKKPEEPRSGGTSHPSEPPRDNNKGKAPMESAHLSRTRSLPANENRGIHINEGGAPAKDSKKPLTHTHKVRSSTPPSRTAAASEARASGSSPDTKKHAKDAKEKSPSKLRTSPSGKVEEVHKAKTASTAHKTPRSSSAPRDRPLKKAATVKPSTPPRAPKEVRPSTPTRKTATATEAVGPSRTGSLHAKKDVKDAKESSTPKLNVSAPGKVKEGHIASTSKSKTHRPATGHKDHPHKKAATERSSTSPSLHRPPKAEVASQA